jgi:hypothetical protein
MKISGNGFTYFVENKEVKSFEEWERLTKNGDWITKVKDLELRTTKIKSNGE